MGQTLAWAFGQGLHDDVGQGCGEIGLQERGLGGGDQQGTVDDVGNPPAAEGGTAGDHAVEDDPQRKQIAALVQWETHDLFGGHESGGTHGTGRGCPQGAHETKIGDFQPVVGEQEKIARFDVQMDLTVCMQMIEGVKDLAGQGDGPGEGVLLRSVQGSG